MNFPPLKIERFALGDWQTNCYVVYPIHPRTRETGGAFEGGASGGGPPCWIVDAGFNPQPMIQFIKSHGLEPQRVVLTHAHVDHIGGLAQVKQAWPDLPVLIHEAERTFLEDPTLNLSAFLDEPLYAPPATGTIRHGDVLELDELAFEVRHTPGHSPGGVTLYQAKAGVALVGDALFAGSIGRTDFPTSDHDALIRSIHQQLLTLPDGTRVLPGHGPATTIGRERASNPYLS